MELSTVTLCLVLAMSGSFVHARGHKPSKNLLTFLNLLSGYYTNQHQVRLESRDHRLERNVNFTILLKPVLLKKLPDKITFFLEDTVNGQVARRRIWVISEDRYGVIYVQNLQALRRGSDNVIQPVDVSHTGYSDIWFEPNNRPECQTVFYSADLNVFSGTILDCHAETDGELPIYSTTFTCHSISMGACPASFKGKPFLPVIFIKDRSYALPHQFTKGMHYASFCHYSR